MKQNHRQANLKLPRFVLTRKNQKGQVAIFVALIFQVVFIFFALLINVGLLVHHKINLQHSADLAAYYGAMKQAEGLNAIAHINFQLRQNWKLFTWRYRILGTFGFTKNARTQFIPEPGVPPPPPPDAELDFPFESIFDPATSTYRWVFNGSNAQYGTSRANALLNGPQVANVRPNLSCNQTLANGDGRYQLPDGGGAIGPHDTPFFCVGHAGIGGWPGKETNCQLDCGTFLTARTIAALPNLNTAFNTPYGGNVAGAVNQALQGVNNRRSELCNRLGPVGASVLARFLLGYIRESAARSQTITMLASNLSQDAEQFVDLDGNKVLDGAIRTFENNLTGANFSGFNAATDFRTYNGLANPAKCRFRDGKDSSTTEFLKKIEFKYVQLFIHNCTWSNGESYLPESVVDQNGLTQPFNGVSQAVKDAILSLYANNGDKFTVGFEKNPNCVEYYGVRASSEPNIPFLPLSKIKLNALAIAKPFGGSIGPSYGKSWPKGSARSVFDDAPTNSGADSKVDKTLPVREPQPNLSITETVFTQPNFSLFVGDKLGLRNLDYVASFHSMLAARDVGLSKPYANENATGMLEVLQNRPQQWPAFDNWRFLDDSTNMREYDILAAHDPANSAGTREIEIAAIAPNQFDIAYYSIEPDFYNNYLTRIVKNFEKIKTASGYSGQLNAESIRPDFGADDIEPDNSSLNSSPLNMKTFSVKDQILLKNQLLSTPVKNPPNYDPRGAGGSKQYIDILNFLVNTQSSLLTGWTFVKYDEYDPLRLFPDAPVDSTRNSMSFGQCFDSWANTRNAVASPTDINNFKTPPETDNTLPSTPGNCVTGGRTGYSVKIVSPSMVNISNTKIENPIDQSFIGF